MSYLIFKYYHCPKLTDFCDPGYQFTDSFTSSFRISNLAISLCWPFDLWAGGQLKGVSLDMFHPCVTICMTLLEIFAATAPECLMAVYSQSVHCCGVLVTYVMLKLGLYANNPQQALCHCDIWWSKVIMTLSSYTLLPLIHCDSVKLTHGSLQSIKNKMFLNKTIQYMPLPYCFIISTQYPIMSAYLGQTEP